MADWKKIEYEYRAGKVSIREIAKARGVSEGAIRKNAKKCGWTRNEYVEPTADVEAVTEEPVRENTQIGTHSHHHTGGAPSSYNPDFAVQAEKLCNLGATDVELADFFGVTVKTIGLWKHAHPRFSSALKTGKAESDERVERSLYHRAIGYSYESVKIFMPTGADAPVYAPYREHVPPDTTACIFWLKNRRSQQWRDVHRHEHGKPGDFDNMSPDELRNYIAREAQELGVGDSASALAGGPGEAGTPRRPH